MYNNDEIENLSDIDQANLCKKYDAYFHSMQTHWRSKNEHDPMIYCAIKI